MIMIMIMVMVIKRIVVIVTIIIKYLYLLQLFSSTSPNPSYLLIHRLSFPTSQFHVIVSSPLSHGDWNPGHSYHVCQDLLIPISKNYCHNWLISRNFLLSWKPETFLSSIHPLLLGKQAKHFYRMYMIFPNSWHHLQTFSWNCSNDDWSNWRRSKTISYWRILLSSEDCIIIIK